MTAPHLASDDLAINAAQARIRDNLEARARACFDAALKRPSLGAVDAVRRALMALHHQWVAGLEREREPVVTELPAPGERPTRHVTEGESDILRAALLASSKIIDGGYMADEVPSRMADIARAQSDFGRNPAPMAPERGECKPTPCVPRFP